MACSLVGGEGLCSLGVCDGCAQCDVNRQANEGQCRGGGYFVTPWNFTWVYFQMVLSKRGPPYSCLLGGNKLNRTDM